MDYNEEAYQQLLKMRANGKAQYNEDRYTESLKYLSKSHQLFETTCQIYEKNNTKESREIAKKVRDALEHARAVATHRRDIMEGKIKDSTITDTMYELLGYNMKEECDEVIKEFFGPAGYWMPGMP